MPPIVILGPQRHHVTVGDAARALGVDGGLASITAGWQEREAEVEELDAHVGHQTVNLMLHRRVESIFRRDRELREAHRACQDQLKRLQELYRVRLEHTLGMAQNLIARRKRVREELVEPEIEDAFETVRRLDRHHLSRIVEVNRRFWTEQRPQERASVLEHRYELAEILDRCAGVAIAGGHVAVLLNRLRLLDLKPLIETKPILAWSAGAMTLAAQIVLFHDTPPQGRGFAEVLQSGLGLVPGVLPLPHARSRLLLNNRARVTLFARRFADFSCLTLGDRSRVDCHDGHWRAVAHVDRLMGDGQLQPLAEDAA